MILVDARPLIALIHQDDNEHRRCREAFAAMNEPLGTVWPALAEAMHLLSFSSDAQAALWEMTESGAVGILPLGMDDVPRMKEVMRKYRDLPMDLADAAPGPHRRAGEAAPDLHPRPPQFPDLPPGANRPLCDPSSPINRHIRPEEEGCRLRPALVAAHFTFREFSKRGSSPIRI